jgi:hypothetical protein
MRVISSPPEVSGKQGDTLLGFSVREISIGRMSAFGLFGVRQFPGLSICSTPHRSAVLPIDTAHAPQRGDAYQRRVQPWKGPETGMRSEGTPHKHKDESDMRATFADRRRSFRTRGHVGRCSQGCPLGWYAPPHWGGKLKGQRRTPNRPIPSRRGKRVPVPFPAVPEYKL